MKQSTSRARAHLTPPAAAPSPAVQTSALAHTIEVAVGPNPDGHTHQAVNTHVDHPDAAPADDQEG